MRTSPRTIWCHSGLELYGPTKRWGRWRSRTWVNLVESLPTAIRLMLYSRTWQKRSSLHWLVRPMLRKAHKLRVESAHKLQPRSVHKVPIGVTAQMANLFVCGVTESERIIRLAATERKSILKENQRLRDLTRVGYQRI